ncbi:unnamed protein product [Amaranthus hypochondriacus]
MNKKVLIFGATGYLGRYMVQASVAMGHLTYAYTRPIGLIGVGHNDPKLKTLLNFKALGVTIVEGELDDHEKLVSILQEVQIVISTLPVPQYLNQLKIIDAMKEANIERFIPSEFGCEADRVKGLPPFQALLDNKKRVRRAIEEANIPYTCILGNIMAGYFIHYIFFHDQNSKEKVTVYGNGQTKAVWNFEKDVAAYTIRAAMDSRTLNKTVSCRPLKNIASLFDVISSWENKTAKNLTKVHMLEEDVLKLTTETIPQEISIPMSILHCIFIKGDPLSIELKEDELEASNLYLDYKYTSIDELLDICNLNPPIVTLSTFV